MKVLLLLTLLSGAALVQPLIIPRPIQKLSGGSPPKVYMKASPNIDLCPTCVSFAGQFINQLLNIILNAGVVGGCADVCQLLEEKVKSELAGVICNLLCDYVGIEEFIKIVENSDLDPIYYCELLKACPIKDDGDAEIVAFKVVPNVVPYGTKFDIEVLFTTKQGTGTGEIDFLILTQDGIPLGQNELSEPLAPGSYNLTLQVEAARDPNCDPTQQLCEIWLPGNYTAEVAICNGECGSKHPHSQVYANATAPFTVTK